MKKPSFVLRLVNGILSSSIGLELRGAPTNYRKKVWADFKKSSFSDINDYMESCHDHMALNAMRKLFSHDVLRIQSGRILEVGPGTGRYTREIAKYVPNNVEIIPLEMDRNSFRFLTEYVTLKNYANVKPREGDYFNNEFSSEEFDIVLLPWFDMTLTLYQWNPVFKEAYRILKSNGIVAFDFMDSQENLIEAVSNPNNAPYCLINGKDLELIAGHVGFSKITEFDENWSGQNAKYHVYQKRCMD